MTGNVITAEKRGMTDGPAYEMLMQVDSPLPIVLISRTNDFQFNEKLLSLDRYILADVCELGWDIDLTKYGTHIWGQNTSLYDAQFGNDEYKKFQDFVTKNPPVLSFVRELLKVDQKETMLPLEYPCWHEVPEVQSKELFYKRPIEAYHYWGRSNEERLRVHGDFWTNASKHGYSVCDNIYQLNHFLVHEQGPRWVTFHMPHYGRVPATELIQINAHSKISLALGGAGSKTFRHMESSINAAMLMWHEHLAWTYEWNNQNSIQCVNGKEIETIIKSLQNENLYDIYCNGVENCRKYYLPNYIAHLEKTINEFI